MMKIILTVALAFLIGACSGKTVEPYEQITESVEVVPLTEGEVDAALRDALSRGVGRGIQIASRKDGFMTYPGLRIGFPQEDRTAEETLRKIGKGSEIDRFVAQLNRSASMVSVKVRPIFFKAITSMDIDDPFDVLEGDADAATRLLFEEAEDELYDGIRPIVVEKLYETGAGRAYSKLANSYNDLPLTFDIETDITDYATNGIVAGMLLLIAEEEGNLRRNSSARTSRRLTRVFGSL